MRAPVVALLGLACGKGGENDVPDGEWKVTVTGVENHCTSDTSGYQEDFVYQLYFEGSNVEVEIDGDSFASGTRSGCTVTYQSAVWLEERDAGLLRWMISGQALHQGEGGGCEIDDDLDWDGTETLTVLESEDPDIAVDCTYEMTVQGTFLGGG